jgi:structural maintenance of chromosomes protein 6
MKRLQELIEIERRASLSMIEDKESQMPLLEEEFFKAEQRYKQCDSNNRLMIKKLELSKEYPWAIVILYEKQLEEQRKLKCKSQSKREKIQAKIDESSQELAQVMRNYNEKKAEVGDCHKLLTNHKDISKAAEKKFKEANAKYKSVNLEIKKLAQNKDNKKKEQIEWINKMNEDKKANDKDFEQERNDKNRKIKQIEDKLEEHASLEKIKQDEHKRCVTESERLIRMCEDKRVELHLDENKIRTKQNEIEEFKRASKNRILRFGTYMADLVDNIKLCYQQKKFKELPKGPIGMHIEVKKPQWAKAIEQCIGECFLKNSNFNNRSQEKDKFFPKSGELPQIIKI